MAYTTAHTGKQTRDWLLCGMEWGACVGQLSALVFPAKEVPAPQFSNHLSDFHISGEGGWVCSEFGEFLLSHSP